MCTWTVKVSSDDRCSSLFPKGIKNRHERVKVGGESRALTGSGSAEITQSLFLPRPVGSGVNPFWQNGRTRGLGGRRGMNLKDLQSIKPDKNTEDMKDYLEHLKTNIFQGLGVPKEYLSHSSSGDPIAQEKIITFEVHFKDLNFEVFVNVLPYCVKFTVYDITAYVPDDDEILDKRLYLNAEIKWDTCSHFWFGEGDKDNPGYLHICSLGDYYRHTKLMELLYNIAKEMLETGPANSQEFDDWRWKDAINVKPSS